MPKLAEKLKKTAKPPAKRRTEPLWKGPIVDGITQSLLSRFLCCRERFRLHVIEGLRPAPDFNQRIEYGNMWHACEEALAGTGADDPGNVAPHKIEWETPLKKYCQELAKKYPTQGSQVEHWYNVCKTQFPLYVDYWRKHPDVKQRTPLLQEQVFDVPYPLPSGRVVRLRGKFDSVDLIGKGKDAAVYLQENKSKGDIDEQMMQRQLTCDLQTMMYLIAMHIYYKRQEVVLRKLGWTKINGVRYNVIRRPLSGGSGSIRKHQPTKKNPDGESDAEFYTRLADIIKAEPETFFMRWKVEITQGDIERFQRECFNPILEQLCDWYEWIMNEPSDPWGVGNGSEIEYDRAAGGVHYRLPFGIYNPMLEGKASELDEYLNTGSELGLVRVDSLFTELA